MQESPGPETVDRARAELDRHRAKLGTTGLRELFAEDPGRIEWATVDGGGLSVDFSRNLATAETFSILGRLADAADLGAKRDAMFAGAPVNRTERRAALHTALRRPVGSSLVVAGVDVMPGIGATLTRMADFADRVRSGAWTGVDGRAIRTVVNVGIGGSDLGPRLAVRALRRDAATGPEVRFVANIDGADLERNLAGLDPAETLVIVCSKTFRTAETMRNARSTREWIVNALGADAVARHFVAATAAPDLAAEFGIDPAGIFGFADWVGGRYSLPSAVGLAVMVAVGPAVFARLLAGFRAMDRHFLEAPIARNIPALHGLLGVWYSGWFGAASTAVVPYAADLDLLPGYLQQLVMESNGKRVADDGRPLSHATGFAVWGGAGTDAQHSFFQLLHQGTRMIPVDLIGTLRPTHSVAGHHELLLANLIAQSRALAFGRSRDELRADGVPESEIPHREVPGNRPHTVITGEELSPEFLGALVAMYEHSTFTQATVWGIDPFDQWGVELGKRIAEDVMARFADPSAAGLDPASDRLIGMFRSVRTRIGTEVADLDP